MNEPMRKTGPEAAHALGRGGFFRQLLRSHLMVAGIGLVMLLLAVAMAYVQRTQVIALAGERAPLAQSSLRMLVGVERSLAGLRGWVSLGDQALLREWEKAWKDDIDPAAKELLERRKSLRGTGQEKNLDHLLPLLADLRESQWWVKSIARTPGNEPARVISMTEVQPIAESLEQAIDGMIGDEKLRHGDSRPDVMVRLLELRAALQALSLAFSRVIEIGAPDLEQLFRTRLRELREIFGDFEPKHHMHTTRQHDLLNTFYRDLPAYALMAEKAVVLRRSAGWNRAQYLMATETVPIARRVHDIADWLADSSGNAMKSHAASVMRMENVILVLEMATVVFMGIAAILLSLRYSGALAKPISELSNAMRRFARGEEVDDIPVAQRDELGDLTLAFNHMRRSLTVSEAGLEEAQRIAKLGSWAMDVESRTLEWSAETYRLMGVEDHGQALVVDDFLETVHSEDLEQVQNAIDQAVHSGTSYEVIHRVVLPDGAVRWIHGRGEPYRDDSGGVVRLVGTSQDITDQKSVEDAFRRLADDLGERVRETTCLYAVSQIIQDPALTVGQIFKKLVKVIPPGWRPPAQVGVRIGFKDAAWGSDEFRETDKMRGADIIVDGECQGRLDVACVEKGESESRPPFPPEKRQLIDEIAARLGEALGQRAVQMERDGFFDLSVDMLCIAGTDGFFRRVSPAWEKTLGWTVKELMKAPIIDFVHPDDKAATVEEANKLAQGEPSLKFENRFRCKDASYRWLEWSSMPADGGVLFAVARDVTDRRRTEEHLKKTLDQLLRTNTELERFAYVASHELLQPVVSVEGFARLLEDKYKNRVDPVADEYIGLIAEGARRTHQMITDLREYVRVDSEPQPFSLVNCNKVVADVLRDLNDPVEESGAEIVVALLPEVRGDERQLFTLFKGLVGNALKFRRHDKTPEIEVRATDSNGEWVFSIRDNGIGIEAKDVDDIFLVFKRLHPHDAYPGTGAGLAVCKGIAQRHGGRIWAESEPDVGTTVFFTIPSRSEKR